MADAETVGSRPVLIFSGHRVDAPGRPVPRFPPSMEAAAARAIDAAVRAAVRRAVVTAAPQLPLSLPVLALTQGAAGGDLLFAEAALRQGLQLRLLQPEPSDRFVQSSVRPSADGERWVERYRAVVDRLAMPPQTLPAASDTAAATTASAPAAADTDAGAGTAAADSIYVRCNRWLLETALRCTGGQWPLQLVCLWNGAQDDGPGGTGQMVQAVRHCGGEVRWIDTRRL